LIQFSRPVGANQSPGTYVDENGIIQLSSADQPRFDHDPTTGESLGLLVEESRTNLVTYSEGFDDASWVGNLGNQSTANATEAPDGQNTAYYFYDTNDGIVSNAGIYRVETLSPSSTYTLSCYFKKALNDWVYLRPFSFDATANGFAWFNISNGTVGTVDNTLTAHTPQYTGNGWYRCSISFTMGSVDVSGGLQFGVVSADGTIAETLNGQLGTYVWGAQLEEGSFPTSYIPTTGTALTRSADVASITGSNFSSWYNQGEGTIFYNFTGTGLPYQIHDGSNSNRFGFSPSSGRFFTIINSVTSFFGINPTVISGGGLAALGYKANDYGAYGNGTVLTGTSPTTVPPSQIELALGFRGNYQPDAFLNGTIARLTYFPERLPDSTLQAITQ